MKAVTAILMALTLAACVDSAPSEADQVRAIPVTTMDQSLALFRQVCVMNGPDTSSGTVVFSRASGPDGRPLCAMRARAPQGVDEFTELRRRYGNARAAGLIAEFPGYPGGTLLFLEGIRNGAGEGTYQIAIRN